MTTRYDVSEVPPQGGYVAKQCPVRAQNDVLVPAEIVPVPPDLQRRFDRGRAFEAEIFEGVEAEAEGVHVIDADDRDAREQATVAALATDALVIVGGRLPTDDAGRRVGEPDLLIRGSEGGWYAADVKHHMTLNPVEETDEPVICSDLSAPLDEYDDDTVEYRPHRDDLLQLAHYQRMLEAAGLAAPGERWGAIVGTEGRLVWYDLDEELLRTPSTSEKHKYRSAMDVYDFEFDFRLDVIAVARQHERGEPAELLPPVRIGECDTCPWYDHCIPILEQGSGDVSLLPRIGWNEWKIHRDHGVTDRAALAALDVPTAYLVATGVDIDALRAEAKDVPGDTELADLDSVRKPQARKLAAAGIVTVDDLPDPHPPTEAYAGSGMSGLPEQIDQARAALGPEPAYRRRGVDEIVVPRGDVEVDIDMENIEDGVYIWGTLLTDRAGADVAEPGYRPFVTWEPLPGEAEIENFRRFWTWLKSVRAAVAAKGLVFRAYCYSAAAENRWLKANGLAAGLIDEVKNFIDSDDWVDMHKVVKDQVMTGHGYGLKLVAPLAGFEWSADDAGGGLSMVRYGEATTADDAEIRGAAREWLLTYNGNDLEATIALRAWLGKQGQSISGIDEV